MFAPDLVVWPGEEYAVMFSAKTAMARYVSTDFADAVSQSGVDELLSDIDEADIASFLEAGILRDTHSATEVSLDAIRDGSTVDFLDLIVSEGCNFGCPHCIHSRDVAAGGNRVINTFMSMETARTALEEFCCHLLRHNKSALFVHIGSAEPLLNWPVVEFIADYVHNRNDFVQKRVTLNSNLALLTEDRARFLIDRQVVISTSLDGVKEDNDKIRVFKSGRGTYDLIIDRIRMLRSLGYAMDSISLTVTDRTIDDFQAEAFIETLRELEMTGVSVDFDLVGSTGVSPMEIARFLLDFYQRCVRSEIECYGTWTKPFENLFRNDRFVAPAVEVGFCKAIEGGNISVSPQGRFHICGYTSSDLGGLGEMKLYGQRLSELLATRRAAVVKHCHGCDLVGACGGQCHATHEVSSAENSQKVDRMCDVYRAVTRELSQRKLLAEIQ